MRSTYRNAAATAILLSAVLAIGVAGGWGQTIRNSSAVPLATGGRTAEPAGGGPENSKGGSPNLHTEKQRALSAQADKLFDLATELKAQVDKTNKNILSLKVVQDAEDIERLAKGVKEQAKH